MVQPSGGGLYQKVNNIIINGGNINAEGSGYGSGIGGCAATADNIIINGGNIIAKGGVNRGFGIGCSEGKIIITGGNMYVEGDGRYYQYYGKANGIIGNEIIVTGGVINVKSKYAGAGLACNASGSMNITGGNILARGKEYNIATYEERTSNLIAYTPINGTNNLYETQIKLNGVGEGKKITGITGVTYGTKDMYTLEDGMLYLYLPLGTRTINIEVDGNTYSGTVETKETSEVVTLNKVN